MNDNKQSLERMNYYNGQRLEAADFRLEQAFHMQVRRELNKWLYTYGIASGLDVIKNPDDKHSVLVNPGLAIDKEGREIILLEPCTVNVRGRPSKPDEAVFGNYVVIEYGEEPVARVEDGCAVPPGKGKESCTLKWNGSSRIRMKPAFSMQNNWPGGNDEGRKIVLAQLELNESCEVRAIRKGVRKYVNAARAPRTRRISIEGEKDIDPGNSKVIYFHIDGDYPERVLLYLKGSLFSTLYYTELGEHSHNISLNTESGGDVVDHNHPLNAGNLKTDNVGMHRHEIQAHVNFEGEPESRGLELHNRGGDIKLTGTGGSRLVTADIMEVSLEGGHVHSIDFSNATIGGGGGHGTHTHPVNGTTGTAGVSSTPLSNVQHEYIDDLQVYIDGAPVTTQILEQLNRRDGAGIWSKLGDGTGTHRFNTVRMGPIVIVGTGAIDLTQTGVDLAPGPHDIRLAVGSGGGKVHYNLYVE